MSKLFQGKRIRTLVGALLTAALILGIMIQPFRAYAKSISYILLSDYSVSMDIGEVYPLMAIASDPAIPKFSSSRSSVATVNSLGMITAKSAGTATVTAKTKHAKAVCKVKVRATKISLNQSSLRLERNENFQLRAKTSSGTKASFKSSKKSVATVTADGMVTGHKPGTANITVSADKTNVTCRVTVKKPEIRLEPASLTLYRHGHRRLQASVSSGVRPKWSSSNSKVVTVNEFGVIAAKKHGTATITATVDGVKRSCRITVKSPKITLGQTTLQLKPGQSKQLTADVSSHNPPAYKSTNTKVAVADSRGKITALKKGTAYIRVSEDGTTVKCKVIVTE